MTNDANATSVALNDTPKRKKIASLDRRKSRSGWFFILPFLIGFVLIYIPMIYESIMLSFQRVSGSPDGIGIVKNFVGWENYYEALFVDPKFVQTLITGLQRLAFDIPAILIFSLFMAVMLNQKAAGRGLFRAIFFIPVILSTGIVDSVAQSNSAMNDYMGGSGGITDGSGQSTADQLVSAMDLEKLFASMKVGTELVGYVTNAINNIFDIVNRAGVQMLIFLAALQSISPAIYESCKIDGATAWETFWKITFPMISPMILVNGVYTIIDSFTSAGNPVMMYIDQVYTGGNAGDAISSAMAWMYFLIVILIVAIIASVLSAFVFYQRKND